MSQTLSNGLFGAVGITASAYCLAASGRNVHFGSTSARPGLPWLAATPSRCR